MANFAKKLILIDGNALVHRAFHALPPTLTSPKGVLTNAVYGFVSVLFKMIKEKNPDYIAATFDLAASTFRHEEFAEYKSHRVKAPDELYAQIPLVKEILAAMGIPVYEKEGFEADDLIGTLAEKAKKEPDVQTVIATGDLDTLQLVEGDKVVVFTLRKGITDTIIYNEKEVEKKYGGLGPSRMTDYKGLKGDPSDNIPGVPGIGEKTAITLISKYKNIENLYEQLAKANPPAGGLKDISPKLAEKLLENKDMALFSKKLATIIRNVDIDFSLEKSDWRKNIDKEKLNGLLKELGLYSLVKRFSEIDSPAVAVDEPKIKEASLFDSAGVISSPRFNFGEAGEKIKGVQDKSEIVKILKKIELQKFLTFDMADGLFNIILEDEKVVSISAEYIFSDKDLHLKVKDLFENKEILKTGHSFKRIAKFLLGKGVHIKGIKFDVELAAYLLNSDLQDFELNKIYYIEFGQNIGLDIKSRLSAIIALKKSLWEKLKTNRLLKVFEDIELPLILVLAEMELAGIGINRIGIEKLSKTIDGEIKILEKDIYKLANVEFNISSPQQLAHILFDILGLKGKVRKTGKGALSTAAAELEKLSEEHPIIELILKYRELQKLKTTYIDPFPALIDSTTSRLHTTYNQTGTTTGRLSSQNPNLQNIPVRTELGQEFRRSFVADNGFQLISFDYSQLELRVVAHISNDEKMTEAFKRGEDIHTRTAAEIFEVPAEKVSQSMRRDAKTLNFGVLYGMGQMGFQRAAGVARERAKEFIRKYMEEFSGVAAYMEQTKQLARQKGFVSTVFGRRRQLEAINSNIPELVRQAERMAINMPVQGTAADLIKMAMLKANDFIHEKYSHEEIKMLLQVHDELLFEVRMDLAQKLSKDIRDIMENIYKLGVPLTVDIKCGDNWSDMKKM